MNNENSESNVQVMVKSDMLSNILKKREATINLRTLMKLSKTDGVEPKNKFNLTEEQIEAMEDMSPKEKKKYLKGL